MVLYFLFSLAVVTALDIGANLNVGQTISYHGYPVETHYVETEDGYIIEMQRIPFGKDPRSIPTCYNRRPVVFMQHGLFGTAHSFVANLPSQSPAFIFADSGFDVWLGNFRGTVYGSKHINMTWDDPRFWNFTLYDHATVDMPNQVDYVLKTTNHNSLYYIGHSEGTLVMFIHLSDTDIKWQNKIRGFYAWGPTAGFLNKFKDWLLNFLSGDLTSLIIKPFFNVKHQHAFGIPEAYRDPIIGLCSVPMIENICELVQGYVAGYETNFQYNTSRIGVYLSGSSYTSWKNALHFAQLLHSHQLQKYDYGKKKNEEIYGSPTPPLLNISRIIAPTYIYFSGDDRLTTEDDAKSVILENIGSGLRKSVDLGHFSHLDYAYGLRAVDDIYKPMILQMYEDLQQNGCLI